jgi:phage gp36-like protein
MSFITTVDLLTSIYPEQLEAITRQDDATPQFGIEAAIEEMKGYLVPKYDVTKMLAKTGTSRSKILVAMVRDMAVFHIISLANPGIDYESKKKRYERAVEYFKQVQKGTVNPPDFILAAADEENNEILMSSNTKRTQHY